jgi:large subunit ribosomal protein L23|tara:strand:- start:16898 stop:17203 length:306 start_codon:yes stop_codon:yes gene_type:complete
VTQQTDSLNLIDYIKYPLITDKATRLLENNKYSFLVDRRADKTSIKIAIESFFKVSVVKVNTINLPRKKRRVGRSIGFRTQLKKAIVTLSEGNKIDIFPDL